MSIIPLLECPRKEFWFVKMANYLLLGSGGIDEAISNVSCVLHAVFKRQQTRMLMYSKFIQLFICHPENGVIMTLSLSHTHTHIHTQIDRTETVGYEVYQ